MVGDKARFVQFPHPGAEHNPSPDVVPWNVTAHRRKFLLADGHYLDASERPNQGELVFWGEWEPPSRVLHRWPRQGRLPRALHQPYWFRPAASEARQNTDPWVFGEQMLYSNCKQTRGIDRRPTSIQCLPAGSVICFGSTIDHQFCVDTVFVVADAQPWLTTKAPDMGEAFTTCTADALTASGIDSNTRFTLYRGATPDTPVHGMYSFVPARPADHPHARFNRPTVHLPELINPACRQSTWGSRRSLPITEVKDAWTTLRDQILAADLVLGTHLAIPPQHENRKPIPITSEVQC